MKKSRFSEEQILAILKEAEAGAKISELCRRHGIAVWTFYTWRRKFQGLTISEARRLRQLEEENRVSGGRCFLDCITAGDGRAPARTLGVSCQARLLPHALGARVCAGCSVSVVPTVIVLDGSTPSDVLDRLAPTPGEVGGNGVRHPHPSPPPSAYSADPPSPAEAGFAKAGAASAEKAGRGRGELGTAHSLSFLPPLVRRGGLEGEGKDGEC
ncbi:MAG: transposase [Nitrospirae bacterium]|nr:transposase [Nitrospirota bacterium]